MAPIQFFIAALILLCLLFYQCNQEDKDQEMPIDSRWILLGIVLISILGTIVILKNVSFTN